MKFYITLSVFFLLFHFTSFAKYNTWDFSAGGNIGLTQCYNTQNEKYRAAAGMYSAGELCATWFFNKRLGVGAGLMLNKYHYETDLDTSNHFSLVYRHDHLYLSIPAFATAHLIARRGKRQVSHWFRLGFVYSHLLSSTSNYRKDGYSIVGGYGPKQDDKSDYKNSVLLASFGLGYNIRLSSHVHISLGLEGSVNLTPVQNASPAIVPSITGGMNAVGIRAAIHYTGK